MSQPLAGAQSIQNRFDANASAAYIDAAFPDGSIRRLRPGGRLEVQRPGQAFETCVPGSVHIEVQASTMPELPPDSSPARQWLDDQNDRLLSVIKVLVNDAELRAISDGERKKAGTNVYSQIVFRTGIVSFYVSGRK